MLVKEIMTKDVIKAHQDMLVGEIAKLIIANKIHGLPVVEDGIPIGMITQSDFFTKGAVTIYLPAYIDLLKKDPSLKDDAGLQKSNVNALLNARAKDIMSTPCITISANADLHEFLGLVKGRNLSSVPVVDDGGNLCGIITLSDVITLIKI